MGNTLFILKGFLQDLLSSFAFTLVFLPVSVKMFKQKIKLPFDTFWNKYVISVWVVFLILLSVFRNYDLHKNKIVSIAQLIIIIIGFFYARGGVFSSEINIPMMRIMLVVFLITIVL